MECLVVINQPSFSHDATFYYLQISQLCFQCLNLCFNGSRLHRCNLSVNCGSLAREKCGNCNIIFPVSRAHALQNIKRAISVKRFISLLHLRNYTVLGNTTSGKVEKVLTGPSPWNGSLDNTLGLHPSSLIMSIGKLGCDLKIHRLQVFLTLGNLLLDVIGVVIKMSRINFTVENLKNRVDAMHDLELILVTELDLSDTSGLKDTSTRLRIGIHAHLLRIDCRINNHPRSSTKLTMRR
mmetsp:Transcript_15386/g.22718  ORF Transcript_15386/g.22718 Transcript_15386/m.22718 type:complete len:238 (-) Transcript_15386:5673-6386(-)